jgi:hypothetical protein
MEGKAIIIYKKGRLVAANTMVHGETIYFDERTTEGDMIFFRNGIEEWALHLSEIDNIHFILGVKP